MPIEANQVLKELIFISEQAWVDADWLEGRVAMLIGSGDIEIKIQGARILREVWKNLSVKLLDDEEKHKHVLTAFDTLIHTLTDQE